MNLIKRKSKHGRKYTLRPERRFSVSRSKPICRTVELPTSADLTPKFPCYDQGSWGTCYANALAAAIQFWNPAWTPSRLFNAWNAAGKHEEDGCSIPFAAVQIEEHGYPPESQWTYTSENLDVEPPVSVFDEASKHHIAGFTMLPSDTLDELKQSLAEGRPVVFGMAVYMQMEGPQARVTGIIETPGWWGRNTSFMGWHAVLAVAYDDVKKMVKFRNSWGPWGDFGCGYLPYDYFTSDRVTSMLTIDGVKEVA